MRVPTPNVSLVELIFCTKEDLTKDKINAAFEEYIEKQKNSVLISHTKN